jgi:hypothetical protein
MALNYRNEPIRERGGDPAFWFSSRHHGDPATTRFAAFAGDPIWFRAVQGSHEEQHSLQVHDMRWRRFRANEGSVVRAQQTFGIAEAFTFIVQDRYGPGDYLYKLSAADDLWLGCWGLIRSFRPSPRPRRPGDSARWATGPSPRGGWEHFPAPAPGSSPPGPRRPPSRPESRCGIFTWSPSRGGSSTATRTWSTRSG